MKQFFEQNKVYIFSSKNFIFLKYGNIGRIINKNNLYLL